MRLIDADKFKENIMSGLYVFCQENKEDIVNAIDSESTLELDDDLIAELTAQIIDLTEFLDSKNIFVWIDEKGKIHECRSKEEREAEYKAAWLKYMIGEVKTNENND